MVKDSSRAPGRSRRQRLALVLSAVGLLAAAGAVVLPGSASAASRSARRLSRAAGTSAPQARGASSATRRTRRAPTASSTW